MRHWFQRLIAIGLILSIAACGGSDGPAFTWLRVMHAMPDTPTVRARFEDFVFVRDVAYGIASDEGGESLLESANNIARLTATYQGPGGAVGGTLLTQDVPMAEDSVSTVIFAGSFDAPEAFTVVTPRLKRPLGSLYVQFAHAALDLGAVDVYVTAPDTELTATAPLATIQPRGASDVLEIPFGDTRIRLTPQGSFDLLMDSGTQAFPENDLATGPGTQWLFVVTPSIVPGPSPVFLVGSTGRLSFRFLDAGTPATVRAIHALQDAPAADLVVATDPPATLFSGLEYRDRSPVLASPPGDAPLQFLVSPGADLIAELTGRELGIGLEHTLFLIGPAEQPTVLFNTSQPRSVATESRLRFANLAPDSKFFSIYLTTTEDEAERIAANRLFRDLRFRVSSDHVVRAPGDYFLTITERFFESAADAADAVETVVLGPTPLALAGGDVLTFVLFAPANEGEPEVLIQFDDRMP
ncbi:MAG: DUF4397 domain-containing protein [Gammaproteobacteria bacterium]